MRGVLHMRVSVETQDIISRIIVKTLPMLNEKQRRDFLGGIAVELGHGGIAFVNSVTGVTRNTIVTGIDDLKETETPKEHSTAYTSKNRIRKTGAGRKPLTAKIPELHEKIQQIIDKDTYGNPEKPLVWTTLSVRKIADLLKEHFNITLHFTSIGKELERMGYSRQRNQKMYQVGEQHPDRDAQFQYINQKAEEFLQTNSPVISVDTKKKENIGNFKNNGSEYRPVHNPRTVLDHDFPIPELGKVEPYGVYVLNDNTGFVNLGVSHDTPEFTGESIERWWNIVGKNTFPNAKRLFITCDGGGSNSSRSWLWKYYLQALSNKSGLEIHVSHFPPGTSKWNKIEHRLFYYISKSWQGQPLIDIDTVVNLIGSTTTTKGLKVKCVVDENHYETKQKITDDQKDSINIEFVGPNDKWNYIIRPNK